MNETFTANKVNKEKWNRRYTNNFVRPKRRNSNQLTNIFEELKIYVLSSDIGIKLLKIQWKLTQIFEPGKIDATTEARRVYILRIASAICWSVFIQLLVTIPFHMFSWFSDSSNIMASIFNLRELFSVCFYLAGYGFLIGAFYVHPIPLYLTRFDYVFYVGPRKILLFGAQLIIVFWNLPTFEQSSFNISSDLYLVYIYYTTIIIMSHNFWESYLFQSSEMNFDFVVAPAWEQLCIIIHRFPFIMKRVFRPFWKCTLIFLFVATISNPFDEISFTFVLSVLKFWFAIAQSQHIFYTIEHLIWFSLTKNLEFAIKDKTRKILLVEALQVQDCKPWIFEIAVRDLLALSENNARCRELFALTYDEAPYLWKDIAELSLETIQQFTKDISHKYETPDKLLNQDLIDRVLLSSNNAQHVFKRVHDRDGFIVSLSTAPTLCSCPLGPTRPAKPVLGSYLSYIFWYHIELVYKLLGYARIIHLWHFFFCPTFGVHIRYQFQESESIEIMIRAVSNICIAAKKHNEEKVIKCTISPFIKSLMNLIEVLEVVPFSKHEIYGLDTNTFGKLMSLKAHAKHCLFSLLQCYEHKLMLFIQDDTLQRINDIILFYEWPLKLY